MGSPLDHEFRSRELADSLRKYLIAANTGGVGLLAIPSMVASCISAVMFFVLGLVFCGLSFFYAQHRELRRRDAAKLELPEPKFSNYQTSVFWNALSFISFIIGSIVGIVCYQLN